MAPLLNTTLQNNGGTPLDAYTYGYDVGDERTNVIRNLGDYVNYAYDAIGQLTNAAAKEPGGVTNRLNEQFNYTYDAAHNLHTRSNNDLVETFALNSLNELSNVVRGGSMTVEGTTGALATNVTVNGNNATLYVDSTFARMGMTLTNGSNVYVAIAEDHLNRKSTNTVAVNLPSTVNYGYDLNGNLTNDGSRLFAYDDENQLISVQVTNAWKSEYVYDGKLRRRISKEYTWQGTNWLQTNEIHFVYDGNLVIQERDTNNLPVNTYTRGNDLSRSLQGAGGIGGLLSLTRIVDLKPEHFYYHADGNGNVTELINSNQFVAAKYLYDPYGKVLAKSGPLADLNTYQFSSKEFCANSSLIYYLYRFYNPNLQRWVNRDLIEEEGGYNLFNWNNNNPLNKIDYLGLSPRGIAGGVAGLLAAGGSLLMNACPHLTCHQGNCQACCGAGLAAGTAGVVTGVALLETTDWGAWLGKAAVVLAQADLLNTFSNCMAACATKMP